MENASTQIVGNRYDEKRGIWVKIGENWQNKTYFSNFGLIFFGMGKKFPQFYFLF